MVDPAPPLPENKEGVTTQSTSKEDVLEDGTRVVHSTIIETYPDGSQCKRTITRRIDTTMTDEENVGVPYVSLSFRNVGMCCCFRPFGAWGGDKDKDKEEEEEEEEEKEERIENNPRGVEEEKVEES